MWFKRSSPPTTDYKPKYGRIYARDDKNPIKRGLDSPHSPRGSSEWSRQSLCLLHTFSMLMHSPVLHLNMAGPSHALAAQGKGSLARSPNTPGEKQAGAARVKARVTYVAAELIAEVRAVLLPVALEDAGDTGAIQTLELIPSTAGVTWERKSSTSKLEDSRVGGEKMSKQRRLTAIDFVGVILAVGASVAPPAAVDALPVRALELMAAAAGGRLLRTPVAILRPLVGPVGTVGVAVAAPLGRDAHRVVALEGAAAAGGLGAGRLV